MYRRDGALSQLLDVKAAALGMPLKTRVFVDSPDACCRMVEAGLGSLCPQ